MGFVGPKLYGSRPVVAAGSALLALLISGCPTTTSDSTSTSSSSSGAATSSLASSTGGSSGVPGSSSRPSSGVSGSAGGSSSSGGVAATCAAYCTAVQTTCTGANLQYPSEEVCLAACSFFPAGVAGATAGNSLSCRAYHVGVAGNGDASSPGMHCPHGGPDGDNTCGTVCDHFCDVVMGACTGANQVYADRAACTTACNSLDATGDPADTMGDSVQCRAYHAAAGVAFNDLTVHCPHAAVNSAACFDTLLGPAMVETASGYHSGNNSSLIEVDIAANALSADATLTVTQVTQPADPGQANIVASAAFSITITGGATLTQPMTITIPISPAPAHPQLAEIWAVDAAGNYSRLPSFYRASDQSVVTDTTQTSITVAAVIRTLQAESSALVAPGRNVFMYETFGNEAFFGGVMGLHEVLPFTPPVDAVGLGAQVDLGDVPDAIVGVLTGMDLAAKDDALDDPAVTSALLRGRNGTGPGAVVGVKAVYGPDAVHECPGPDGRDLCPTSIGITCALCHVTVTPTTFALTAGMTALPIGTPRFDGLPNYRMNAGAILALTPFAQDNGVEGLLNGWGPGRFDIRALPDNPLDDGSDNPTKFPPLWNFVDLEEQSYTYDWDGLFQDVSMPAGNNVLASQAEAVYDLVMHANGAFAAGLGNLAPELAFVPTNHLPAITAAETAAPGNDIVTARLTEVQSFQRSITSPAPGAFNETDAEAGFRLFYGRARCVACHATPEFTGSMKAIITAVPPTGDLGEGVKTPPLRGISSTAPYFHNSSAATLADVVARYVARGGLTPTNLTATEQNQLVEYLKSL